MPRRAKRELSTDRQIKGIRPPAKGSERAEYRIKSIPGLMLRVSPSNRKIWGYKVKDSSSGRWRVVTLGPYPTVSLERARTEAKRLDVEVLDGKSPFARHHAPTLAELGEQYLVRHARPKKRSADEDERKLNVEIMPVLGAKLAEDVGKIDVVRLLNGIVDRGAPVTANRTLSLIRKIYNWGIAEGYLATNPASGLPMRAKEEPRERVLTDDELRTFWLALDGHGFDTATADALRLQYLLGARIREVTDLPWAEINLDPATAMWVLPKERAKGKCVVLRPLPPMALSILNRRRSLDRQRAFVFASPVNPSVPLTARAPTRAVQRAAELDLVPKGFTPHDLRRTAATKLASLGVSETVAKRILGHKPPQSDMLASVYNRHAYIPEMSAALASLESDLRGLISRASGGSVLTFVKREAL